MLVVTATIFTFMMIFAFNTDFKQKNTVTILLLTLVYGVVFISFIKLSVFPAVLINWLLLFFSAAIVKLLIFATFFLGMFFINYAVITVFKKSLTFTATPSTALSSSLLSAVSISCCIIQNL